MNAEQIATGSDDFSFLRINDQTLASGSEDETIKIWNVKNGGLITTLTGYNWIVHSLIKLNEHFFMSGSPDSQIKIWSSLD